jgi:hypothetical protein
LCARDWQLLHQDEETLAALAMRAVLLHAGGKIRKLGNAAIQHDKNDAAEQGFSRMVDIYPAAYGERHFFAVALSNPGSVFAKF